jgi:hypothetical protein
MMDDVEPSYPDHCTKGQRYAPPPITRRSSPGSVNFSSPGATRPVAWRNAQLEALRALLTDNHDELCDAFWKDLRRNVNDRSGSHGK